MNSLAEEEKAIVDRTVRALTNLGFDEAKARKAVTSIGDPSDANLAMNWLFDHGEEDKGGAVKFELCPHIDALGHGCLVQHSQLQFGQPCVHGCKGDENWICLQCSESRCGRYGNCHAVKHWQKTKEDEEKQVTVADAAGGRIARGHCLTLSLSDLSVWCYECDGYVQHQCLVPLVKAMERLKFGGDVVESETGVTVSEEADALVGSPIPATPAVAHGRFGNASWSLPALVRACKEEARPGYKSMKAHEYLDDPDVLQEKVRVLADLV